MGADERDVGLAPVPEAEVIPAEKRDKYSLATLRDELGRSMMETAKIAADVGPILEGSETVEEATRYLATLSRRERGIARAASKPQSEAPSWLLYSLRFNEVLARERQKEEEKRINIQVNTQNNHYIGLPPKMEPLPASEVQVIEPDEGDDE